MKNILLKLGLAENADENAALQAIASLNTEVINLKAEKQNLETQLQSFNDKAEADRKVRVKNLIDLAISEKKITEAMRESYTTLADLNYEHTEKILNGMKAYKPLHMVHGQGTQQNDERAAWTFADWHKKDPKGLETMKVNDPENFKLLFKNQHGTEPKL